MNAQFQPVSAVWNAFDFLFALALVGVTFGLFMHLVTAMGSMSVQDDVYDLAMYFWYGSLVIVLIFSPFWFFNKLKEWKIYKRL